MGDSSVQNHESENEMIWWIPDEKRLNIAETSVVLLVLDSVLCEVSTFFTWIRHHKKLYFGLWAYI